MNKADIRALATNGIRQFVWDHTGRFKGRVLDYGCGIAERCKEPQPYRGLIESSYGAEYVPYDVGYPEPSGHFNCVLVTQVLQFFHDPRATLKYLCEMTDVLVMTYSTCWEEIEGDDRWRVTKRGMEMLVREAGFTVIQTHDPLWSTKFDDFELVGGYGIVATR